MFKVGRYYGDTPRVLKHKQGDRKIGPRKLGN